jgi:hypothetical protein
MLDQPGIDTSNLKIIDLGTAGWEITDGKTNLQIV